MTSGLFSFTIHNVNMKIWKKKIGRLLRWSEKYTKTDMIYAARGGSWLVLGRIILNAITFATMLAFANFLPQETYGSYQFIISIVVTLKIFSLPGMNTALLQSTAKGYEGSLIEAFKVKTRWSLIGAGILLIIAAYYAINENVLLAGSFFIIALFFPFRESLAISSCFWGGKKKFDTKTFISILIKLGGALALIPTLILTDNLWIIILVIFSSSILLKGLTFIYTSKQTENSTVDEEMISYGKNLTGMKIVGQVTKELDKIILWTILGPAEVAIYSFTQKPLEKIRKLMPFESLALPKLTENGVRGRKRKIKILKKIMLLFLFTGPVAVITALAAPWLYELLLPQYQESVVYFQILVLLLALKPLSLTGTALTAEKKIKYLYITRTTLPILRVTLFLIFTPLYGLPGMIGSLVANNLIGKALNLYFFWRM